MNTISIIVSLDPKGLGGILDPRLWVILDELRAGLALSCGVLVVEGMMYYCLIVLTYVGFSILMVSLPAYFVVFNQAKVCVQPVY